MDRVRQVTLSRLAQLASVGTIDLGEITLPSGAIATASYDLATRVAVTRRGDLEWELYLDRFGCLVFDPGAGRRGRRDDGVVAEEISRRLAAAAGPLLDAAARGTVHVPPGGVLA